MSPTLLGVPLMDRDHAEIEARLDGFAACGDDRLAAAFDEIETAIRAHFAREEELFRARRIPIADCHATRHAGLLAAFEAPRRARDAGDLATLRRFLVRDLPAAIGEHVDTVDRVTAGLLLAGDGGCGCGRDG